MEKSARSRRCSSPLSPLRSFTIPDKCIPTCQGFFRWIHGGALTLSFWCPHPVPLPMGEGAAAHRFLHILLLARVCGRSSLAPWANGGMGTIGDTRSVSGLHEGAICDWRRSAWGRVRAKTNIVITCLQQCHYVQIV